MLARYVTLSHPVVAINLIFSSWLYGIRIAVIVGSICSLFILNVLRITFYALRFTSHISFSACKLAGHE
jgi:hypothetical protein